jgi:hypothetical protein
MFCETCLLYYITIVILYTEQRLKKLLGLILRLPLFVLKLNAILGLLTLFLKKENVDYIAALITNEENKLELSSKYTITIESRLF